MVRPAVLVCVILLLPATGYAQDALAEARRSYNSGEYEAAERLARQALRQPSGMNGARVVLGRIHLERYRQTDTPQHLTDARAALRDVDPHALSPIERLELTIGLGETLFLEDRFAAAADLFGPVLDSSMTLGPSAHDRVLDWWATSLDRHAQGRPAAERAAIYDRIGQRAQAELAHDPGSGPANYWSVASVRGRGDVEGAWSAAMAAWVRASLGRDRGAALRADLDRLITDGIIPERAARLEIKDTAQAIAGMQSEWDLFKVDWSRR